MRRPAGPTSIAGMSGAARLVVTLELDVSEHPVRGRVRLDDDSARAFSGWSELFAVLQAVTSEAAGDQSPPSGGIP
ncbi:MAG: hypothetical protein JWN32_2828 [Solirubrobacterales bacterium]|jgi:hypothetical protein|nr:hypothetical protein [Solirubrobacterales bacterium]